MKTYYNSKRAVSYNRTWRAFSEKTLAATCSVIDLTRLRNFDEKHFRVPRILDVACGTGLLLQQLARLIPHAELYGVDESGDMLAQARLLLENYPGIHFTKAALGKALQLGDWLKTPDPHNPMPDHFVVLRHQDGDAWDYVVITHLGPKASVEAAGTAVPPDKRDLSAWHTDTFVNGPSWEEFSKAMGIGVDSKSKTTGSVYSVSYYRPAPGHREQLEKVLSEAPSAPSDTTAGNVLMQHLEGAAWTFLTIARYNSWDDFARDEKASVANTTKKDSPWYQLRDHTDLHTDTLTDRIAP